MCNALVRLSNERESIGSGRSPVLQGLHCGAGAIRVIHFDAVKLGGVILEELARWRLRRIEIRLPRRVSPAGGSNVDFMHGEAAVLRCNITLRVGKTRAGLDSPLLRLDGRSGALLPSRFGFRLCCKPRASAAGGFSSTAE